MAAGLRPDPLGELIAFTGPLSGFMGGVGSPEPRKRRGRGKRRKEGNGKRGEKRGFNKQRIRGFLQDSALHKLTFIIIITIVIIIKQENKQTRRF